MTPSLQGWLDSRSAGVPAELMERIRLAAAECLGIERAPGAMAGGVESAQGVASASAAERGASRGDAQVQAFLQVVRSQLDALRHRECSERKDALDLLAADALITYALELVASARPDALDRYAVELMHMVGRA